MSDHGTVLPVLALVMVGGALAVALTVEVGRCGAAWRAWRPVFGRGFGPSS